MGGGISAQAEGGDGGNNVRSRKDLWLLSSCICLLIHHLKGTGAAAEIPSFLLWLVREFSCILLAKSLESDKLLVC